MSAAAHSLLGWRSILPAHQSCSSFRELKASKFMTAILSGAQAVQKSRLKLATADGHFFHHSALLVSASFTEKLF
jgi:hypothetical protein